MKIGVSQIPLRVWIFGFSYRQEERDRAPDGIAGIVGRVPTAERRRCGSVRSSRELPGLSSAPIVNAPSSCSIHGCCSNHSIEVDEGWLSWNRQQTARFAPSHAACLHGNASRPCGKMGHRQNQTRAKVAGERSATGPPGPAALAQERAGSETAPTARRSR